MGERVSGPALCRKESRGPAGGEAARPPLNFLQLFEKIICFIKKYVYLCSAKGQHAHTNTPPGGTCKTFKH